MTLRARRPLTPPPDRPFLRAMASLADTDTSPHSLHDDLRRHLTGIERTLRDVLDKLAQAEGELARLRAGSQVEARRGY